MVDSAAGRERILERFWIAGVALGLGACGGGGASGPELGAAAGASSCTALATGDAITLDVDGHVLASDGVPSMGAGALTPVVLPSGSEVYWYDGDGSVFVERQDQRVVELRHVEPSSRREGESALGLAANSEHLYGGYAHGGIDDTGWPAYEGPGHLLSISKQDGQMTSLLDYEEGWLAPILADDERVIVFGESSQVLGFYQVPLDHPQLEALPLGNAALSPDGSQDHNRVLALWELFLSGQLVGDQVYWVNTYAPPRGRVRSGFDDAEPELLSALPGHVFLSAGPSSLMTGEPAIDSAKHVVGLDFMLTDDAGCRSVPGPRGERLGAVTLDSKYAYWSGYRTSGSEATFDPTLNRVDLDTGAVARLNAPGLTLDNTARFVAQDDTRLFLWNNGALLSLRKP